MNSNQSDHLMISENGCVISATNVKTATFLVKLHQLKMSREYAKGTGFVLMCASLLNQTQQANY